MMKAALLGHMPGIDQIQLTDIADPGKPGPGEVRVRIHSNSLNFHDYNVAAGILPSVAGRLLMSGMAPLFSKVLMEFGWPHAATPFPD